MRVNSPNQFEPHKLPKTMETDIDDVNILNDEEVITDDTPKELGLPEDPVEVEPKDEDNSDAEALKQRNQELYEQLKKAKGFKRDPKSGKWVKPEPKPTVDIQGTGDVTKTELYSLVKANVPDEDVNEVTIYARSHNMTVTEALKLPQVKAILRVNDEMRKTAEAANTRNARYGASKPTEEQLLQEASEGKIADPATMASLRDSLRIKGKKM